MKKAVEILGGVAAICAMWSPVWLLYAGTFDKYIF